MHLSLTINKKWILCTLASIFGCLILFSLNKNENFASVSTVTNTKLEHVPVQESWPPMPSNGTKSEPIEPFMLVNNFNNFSKPTDYHYMFPLKEKQPISPPIETGRKQIVAVQKIQKPVVIKKSESSIIGKRCNMFDGRWVYKPGAKPSYDSVSCPFIEEKLRCRMNRRPDSEYEKWRWEAKDCNIPLFNGTDMLERLRNKRMVIVGDSLNRNMWESLTCLLYTSIKPSRAKVYAKIRDYKYIKAKDYNAIVEFHWSPFLVEFDENPKRGKRLLVLDKVSSNSKLWQGADIMVFNSGNWWAHTGQFKRWNLFQYKGKLMEQMPILLAYDRGMKTWGKWVQKNVDPKKTIVFFRSISPTHNVGKVWCYNSTQPIVDESYEVSFPKSMINIIERLIKGMKKFNVHYLNITKLSKYRNDAHPSVYRNSNWKNYMSKYKKLVRGYADCSHWCLPGLPDTWNQLLYGSLFFP